ncbi:hypothetical protein P3S68_012816 [Capsicum galapagoense]
MKGNRLNNQQKLKCALVWFVHAMLLAKDPSKKVNSNYIKIADDLEFFGGYSWGKKSFELTLNYLKKKTDLTKQKEAFVKKNNTSYAFGYMRPFLIWEGTYMKTFKPYTNEVKNTSINVLKVQLIGVTVLTSSAEVADEDEDLGSHHYVLSPPRACDHAGLSGLKPSPDASNDDDLHERVALLEKSLLDITSFVKDERLRRIEKNKKQQEEVHLNSPPCSRHQVNLEEFAVAVIDMAAAAEKKEEKEKHEEMTAEAEEENEKKTKEDGEKKSKEEDKNEKGVEEELVVEQEVENIEEEKKSSSEEEKENEKKEVEEEEKKYEEKEVDVIGIVAELNQENE